MEENIQNQNQNLTQPQPPVQPTPVAAPPMEATQPPPSNANKKAGILVVAATLLIFMVVTIIFMRTNTHKKASAAPDLYTFYTAEVDNEPVLYFKMMDMSTDSMNPSKQIPYTGIAIPYKDGNKAKYDMGNFVDFRKLKNVKKAFGFDKFATIESLMVSEDKTKLIFSFSGGQDDNMSYIYQIDLSNNNSKKIWEHQIATGEPPYNGGIPHIVAFVPDEYVAFEFLHGDIPPTTLPSGVVVKNIKSGAEKSIGVVGDVQIDTDKKIVSYKHFDKVKLPCEKPKDPKCFATDTFKTGYGTVGNAESQPLP